MRFCQVLACGISLPLFVASVFAQSTQQSAQQTAPTQQTAPATPSNVPPLQLHDLPADPHTPTPEEQAQQKAAQMRLELTRVASAQANWGPPISTPGMSLDLKETGRKTTPAGTEITWQLAGKGYTRDMQLILVRWPLNQNITSVMSGIVVNDAGTAVCGPAPPAAQPATGSAANQVPSCSATMEPGTPVTITATAAKGEAIRVGLVASDRQHGAATSVVPFPIEGADKGCKIDVILGAKNADLVLIKGTGFHQDAEHTMGTESWGQKHNLNATITADGHFVAALTPWIPGHDDGDTVVYYQSSTCTPTVSFHWGKDTYKPITATIQ